MPKTKTRSKPRKPYLAPDYYEEGCQDALEDLLDLIAARPEPVQQASDEDDGYVLDSLLRDWADEVQAVADKLQLALQLLVCG